MKAAQAKNGEKVARKRGAGGLRWGVHEFRSTDMLSADGPATFCRQATAGESGQDVRVPAARRMHALRM